MARQRGAPALTAALAALVLQAVLGGCAHTVAIGSPPPPEASVDEREQFYRDYRIADPEGERAERCLLYAVDCACDHPCTDFGLWNQTRLGNGGSVADIRDLAPLVGATPAGGALATYALARTFGEWLGMIGGCALSAGILFLLVPPLLDLAIQAVQPSDPAMFSLVLVGSLFGVAVVAGLGAVAARVTELVASETFFELYNPSLRQRLGLPPTGEATKTSSVLTPARAPRPHASLAAGTGPPPSAVGLRY